MKKMSNKGFTLIELMIVVAIIGILAAIAIPNFIRYQLKSKQGESKTVMGGIKTSEEAFRAEYDNYGVTPCRGGCAPTTTKQPFVVAACPAACTRTAIASCSEFECIGYRPTGNVYFGYQVATAAAGIPNYHTCANGDLDGDGTQSGFSFCSDNANSGACGVGPPGNFVAGPIATIPQEVTGNDPSNY